MTIIIFLIILSALVIVHELGHFTVAKKAGIRVDEFGLGYPPRAKKLFNWKGTDFTLNWLPFGGFVKIFGESPTEEDYNDPTSFPSKPKLVQVSVLVAGVFSNFIFAWLLISVGFMLGLPASVDSGLPTGNSYTIISEVVPHSPAADAGLRSGDRIVSVSRGNIFSNTSPDQISSFIASAPMPVTLNVIRGKQTLDLTVAPNENTVPGKFAIGIGLDTVGTVKLALPEALWDGAKTTWNLTTVTASSLFGLIKNIFVGRADFSQISGPVGIVNLVGDARQLGFSYLLSLTALISINLSIINLLPIPALDGGRVLFVAIEAIQRKKISPKIFNTVNNTSFALLVILMILITIRDIHNLF